MRRLSQWLVCSVLASACTGAFAASALTPQQCRAYPFVRPKGPLTHKMLMDELSELESVGYEPSAGDEGNYPDDIDTAQAKLMQKYRHDCLGASQTTTANQP
ncbi:DUF4148 domain-containing protein [Burkholderia sp. BCC1630]|uniref:DUF4148 domain-containing protein n=1 Tax=unclassified Burkholderia TaxID=2613784 RepID=UPI0007538B16|nr:DUF4148 domain-containing protein [Burkholderia sp. BCC1630]KUY50844.1 hypothetical protein WS45_28335 [Burkholderia sp. RF2-non_BP3]KUY80238.1 hypothetical protein WS46_19050 [Burkholderia sp. RF4-BP95]KUY95635.1 hypothetical protein WS48_17575 [Burkholderia sp. RF7-non_BP1]KUY98938.1 hypothetical protein WS49_19070 [Burkholderia sp. RF7-non_BP4]